MGAYSAQVIADGASHYWRLGEPSGTVAADSIAGGANAPGTISGGVTLGAAGPLADGSTAMLFDGTTGKVLIPPATIAPAFTVELWFKTTWAMTGQRAMVSGRNEGGFAGIYYFGVNGSFGLTFYDVGFINGVGVVTDGQWHHAAFVKTGSASLIYLDGAVNQTAAKGAGSPDTGQVSIGFDLSENVGLQSTLAEVAVYPLALTPAQIATHYALRTATGGGGSAPPLPWPLALAIGLAD